jgi:hypothetical protein
MAGERSAPSFHHILDGLETALRDVRRVVIPNASHSSNFDNPQAFERAALTFLAWAVMAGQRASVRPIFVNHGARPFVTAQ